MIRLTATRVALAPGADPTERFSARVTQARSALRA
jgi:hypothetical protein